MPYSLLQPLRDIPFAFVDTETTGASADFGHRVIELGIVRVENGVKVAEYQQLIDPQRKIGAGVSVLTGITQDMVAGMPTFEQQLPAAMPLLEGAVIVGHNIRFDLSFLHREFRRSRCDLCEKLGSDAHVMDTVRIARRRFGRGGNGLQRLAARLGVVPTTAHRALADAVTTFGVFEIMISALAGWYTTLADALLAQGGRMGLLAANPRGPLLPLELEEALEARRPVMMEYLDARQKSTRRVVHPQTIRRFKGELTLVAHCELRQAQRTFKVERIVQLERIEAEAPQPTAVVETELALMDLLPSQTQCPAPPTPAQTPEPMRAWNRFD